MVEISGKRLINILKRKEPNIRAIFDSLHVDILRIQSLQKFLSEQACPKCGKTKVLKAIDYEIGGTGWEAKVTCSKCRSQGIFNETGFHFKMWNGAQSE